MAGFVDSFKLSVLFCLNNIRDKDILRWHFIQSRRLERFRKLHEGDDCFIIGNGPSLRKMDLSPLQNYYVFGLNKIHLLLDKVNLGLSYHVAVNPLVIEQSAEEFKKLGCPSFLSYKAARPIVGDDKKFYYLATNGVPCSFQPDVRHRIYEGFTVTYVALQLAFFMGFSRVFLIGVDHSFIVSGNPNEQQYLVGTDPNHFDPNYFANKHWHLPDLEGSELSYHLARFFYSRGNKQILDATVDGKLAVFPKISYESALSLCKVKAKRP